MMPKFYFFAFFFFACGVANADDAPVPSNLRQAVKLLLVAYSDSLKNVITNTDDDKLYMLCYPWSDTKIKDKVIYRWIDDDNQGKDIDKYLAKAGINNTKHKQTVVLIALKTQLSKGRFEEKLILQPYQLIERKWASEDRLRFTTDSLRGNYIPADLQDCFKRLDKMFSDSTKREIKKLTEDGFSSRAHMGLGMNLRNNWMLWGGSRLSKYFDEIGIHHPEDMTGVIFDSYHRYLTGRAIRLSEQVKYYTEYWAKAKTEELHQEKDEFAQFRLNDTLAYKYRFGYVSKKQEKMSDNDSCEATGVLIEKDEAKLTLKVRLINACDPKGIVIRDSKYYLEWDEVLRKYVEPRKRKIERAKVGSLLWFRYTEWEERD